MALIKFKLQIIHRHTSTQTKLETLWPNDWREPGNATARGTPHNEEKSGLLTADIGCALVLFSMTISSDAGFFLRYHHG